MTAKENWIDVYFSGFEWYRKFKGGVWHQHQFTKDAAQIGLIPGKKFWARYDTINRYSTVINTVKYL